MHTLVIGPNSDAEIEMNKGPTIMNGKERAEIVRALKWGDEVAPDTPYQPSEALLDSLNCQSYIHGDDPCMSFGVNMNEYLRERNRFIEVRRTTGISTTDLTGRLLKLIEPDCGESVMSPVDVAPT